MVHTKLNPIFIESDIASCDGTGTESGHPLVFLEVEEEISCPYCSKIFRKISSTIKTLP